MKLSRISRPVREATRPYTKKLVDPALMTFSEYHEMLNPDSKLHPSHVYKTNVDHLNQYQSPKNYPTLLNTITRHGIVFEVRESQEDRWEFRYVKTTPDGGIVRDEDGQALYMDRDEVAQMIPENERFRYDHAVIEKRQNRIVGNTQDEWGALLVRVADEYQGFGFGTLLVKLNRDKHPKRQSGGLTNSGYANLRRVHAQHVRDYLSNGFYSFLVRRGDISKDRVKEIVDSIPERKQHKQKNLDTSNPDDWLVMSDEQSFAIMYDRKIYQLDEPDDEQQQYWANQFIIGMASLGHYGTDEPPFVNRTYGTDSVQAFLLEILLNQEIGEPIRMEPEEARLVKARIGDKLKAREPGEENRFPIFWIEEPTLPVSKIIRPEKIVRKRFDPYREWYNRIITWAESLGD